MNSPYATPPTPPLSWRERAACRGTDPEDWYPDPSDDTHTATLVRICDSCPVRQDCLDAALAEEAPHGHSNRHGIRGGLTPDQRHQLAADRSPHPLDPDRCKHGHQRPAGTLCRACRQQQRALQSQAAAILGMTARAYAAEHGWSMQAAQAIIDAHTGVAS